MKKYLSVFVLMAGAMGAQAATLATIPSPVAQGGMIHTNVVFLDQPTGTFDIHVDAGIPGLKPLALWSPGDNFSPSDPWHGELDPSQQGLAFNSQYGFLLDVANSDTLPSGSSIGIRLLSATAGLDAWFYRGTDGSEAFDHVFTSGHDHVLWNGTMWHPVFTAATAGNYSATFEFFFADVGIGTTAVDYTTTAGEMAGYSLGQVTLDFTAIPEPSAWLLLVLGAGVLGLARKRHRK